MARLKSLTSHVPGDFQFLQPEAGQAAPFKGSFSAVCDKLQQLREGNAWLAKKHGWRTDRAGVEADVEAYNVARCKAQGWWDFITDDEDTPPNASGQRGWLNPLAGAAEAAKRTVAGVGALLALLGPTAKAVQPEVSEKRAWLCAVREDGKGCPKNQKGNWTEMFTKPVIELITAQLGIKNDLDLRTPHDDKLETCTACKCPMKLKVHAELRFIRDKMNNETTESLDPRCWILHETP